MFELQLETYTTIAQLLPDLRYLKIALCMEDLFPPWPFPDSLSKHQGAIESTFGHRQTFQAAQLQLYDTDYLTCEKPELLATLFGALMIARAIMGSLRIMLLAGCNFMTLDIQMNNAWLRRLFLSNVMLRMVVEWRREPRTIFLLWTKKTRKKQKKAGVAY